MHLRVVHVQQFCSNVQTWRVTFHPPDGQSLNLHSGVYLASAYTLTNGFGLKSVGRIPVVVPWEGKK